MRDDSSSGSERSADALHPAHCEPAAHQDVVPRRFPRRAAPLMWLLVALVLLAVVRLHLGALVEEVQYALTRGRERASAELARAQLASLDESSAAFRLVAQSVGPSVVHIDTLRVRETTSDGEFDWPLPRRLESTGQGSGVIVDAAGYILTNYHVIKSATKVDVRLSDGRTLREARVVGTDPLTDLAVLKIEADGLVAAPWGDSQRLEVGDWVLAVGNPFGLDRSVTAGIVSAKRRRNVVHNMPYQDFLQTDAAVNPGNSGGPLVNLRGEVVGITTAIVGESYQGVGFAIPSDIARTVYERLKSSGYVARGWLGISMQEVTPELSTQLQIPREGVRIERVVGGPARRAGLKTGDVILEWNGKKVADPTDLSLLIAATEVNSAAKVTIFRQGQRHTLDVTVGRRDLPN
jgi:serine protease Do